MSLFRTNMLPRTPPGETIPIMKSTVYFTLVLACAFLLLLVIKETEGKTITVDDDDGRADYERIQDAVNASENGDTIRVYEGTYYENVLVNKTVSLIGNGSANTTIDGTDTVEYVVRITSPWCNISRFTVTGSGDGHHTLLGGIKVETDHNHITENHCSNNEKGIYLLPSADNYITNNTCTQNEYGIYLEENSRTWIMGNTCSYNNHSGIHLEQECYHNTLTDNTCTGNLYGVSLNSSNEDNTLKGTTCLENVYGISLRGGTDNTLTGNTCTNNSRYGIWLSRSNFNTISGNTCSHNAEYGIFLWNSSNNNELQNNVCSDSGGGISLLSSKNNTLSDNVCQDNLDGISLHSSENTTLTSNIMMENGLFIGGDGLEYWSTHTIDSSNTVNGKPLIFMKNRTGGSVPSGAGQVILAACSGVLMSDQEYNNGTVGILLGYSSVINLTNISCRYNIRYGIYLFSCENISFSDISCQENREYGIYLHSTGNCSLESISCSLNYYGFSLRQSWGNTISNSTFSQNHGDGVLIHSSGNNTLSNNAMKNNKNGIRLLGFSTSNTACKNTIHGNRMYGVDSSDNDGYELDARSNWWGDDSGPYHPEQNKEGRGDNVTDHVRFDPWTGPPLYPPPHAIIDSVSPAQALEDEMVTFEGHGEGSCDIIRYVWRSSIDKELYNGTSPRFSSNALSNGTHTIYFRVQDDCGGWSGKVNTTLTVNGVPRVNIDSITPDHAFENDTIRFSGHGTDDGFITRLSWRSSLDGWLYNGTNSSFSLNDLSAGVHTIFLKVEDDSGIWSREDTAVLTINVSTPPNKRPLITITTPSNNSELSGVVNITGTAVDEDGDIEKVEISINESAWVVAEGGELWWYVWSSSAVEDGSYIIKVRALDGKAYSDEVTVKVLVDNPEEILRPDFVVERDFISLEPVEENENLMNLTVRVSNEGETSGQVEVKIYLDTVSTGSAIHSELIELHVHTSKSVIVSWEPLDERNVTIIVVLEDRSAVPEENKDNNQASRSFTLEVAGNLDNDDDEETLPGFTPPFIMVTVSIAGTFVFLFVLAEEATRYRLFLFFFPLFSRLTKEDIEKDIEQQNIRGQIYQHIKENPGTHYSRVVRAVEAGNGTTTYHLHVLETIGFVKSMKKGLHKYYFKSDAVFPYKLQSKLTFTELEILKALNDAEEMAVGEVAEAIDKAVQTASYNIKNLERKDLVKSHKKHQVKMCSLTQKGEKYLEKHLKV